MLHSAKPLLNGVTHCQRCQARNRANTHPLMKAVTFLLGTYLLMHIHSVFLNFSNLKITLQRWDSSLSPEDFNYLAAKKNMQSAWLSPSGARFNNCGSDHSSKSSVHIFFKQWKETITPYLGVTKHFSVNTFKLTSRNTPVRASVCWTFSLFNCVAMLNWMERKKTQQILFS